MACGTKGDAYGGLAAVMTAAGGLAAARQAPVEHVRIALVGDSTVAEGGGWGPGFRAAFGPAVEVLNFAQNGRSSKGDRAEGFWAPALAARPPGRPRLAGGSRRQRQSVQGPP